MTTNTTRPQPAARVEEIPYIAAGDVITQAGTEYFVYESHRGSLDLVRLHDLADGYKANVTTHRIKAGRKATEEERGRVYAMKLAKLEADAKFRPGALVRPTKASKHVDVNTLYVITKTSTKTVSIVELGGNASNAYVNAPRQLLAIIDPADVLARAS
ncbi:hypothetical protein [Arthrobacter sp. MAHUQ-56]